MDERLLIYDKILRNKKIVRKLQNSGRIPSRDELNVINYYSYRDVKDKLIIEKEIKELSIRNDISDDDFSEDIDNVISTYESGLKLLEKSDNIYILSYVDEYSIISTDVFGFDNKRFEEKAIHIYDSLQEILDEAYEYNYNVFKVYIVNKSNKDEKLVYTYGRMEDKKIHLYQITEIDYGYQSFRAEYIPYENGSKIGYYLPFMEKPEYLGIGIEIGPDDNGTWYGFIEDSNTGMVNAELSYLSAELCGNIATYDFYLDFLDKYDIDEPVYIIPDNYELMY